MDIDITTHQTAILTGLLVSAIEEAQRDQRAGAWVEEVSAILSRVHQATNQPMWRVSPTGREPFGTRVTFWSQTWGNVHAVILSSPKTEAERGFLDTVEYGIVTRGAGMTFVGADELTLGWHPEAESIV